MKRLIDAKPLQAIPFASAPPGLGGEIKFLTPDEFQSTLARTYREGIFVDEAAYPELKEEFSRVESNLVHLETVEALNKEIENRLKAPNENIAICHINPQVGYGLFATGLIPRGTVVCLYSGKIVQQSNDTTKDYTKAYYGTDLCFQQGADLFGISGFMQHLPSKPKLPNAEQMQFVLKLTGQNISLEDILRTEELFSIEFSNKDEVATANVEPEFVVFNEVPIIALVANRDIPANEQIGFSYGYGYWDSRKIQPEFFDRKGRILPPENYHRIFGKLDFDGFSYTGLFKPLLEELRKSSKGEIELIAEGATHVVSRSQLTAELVRVRAIHEPSIELKQWRTKDPAQAIRRAATFADVDTLDKLLTSVEWLEAARFPEEKECPAKYIDRSDDNPNKSYTALHIAVRAGEQRKLQVLLAHQARYDIVDKHNQTAADLAVDKGGSTLQFFLDHICKRFNSENDRDKALRVAANSGDVNAIKILLASNIEINSTGETSKQTALHRAVRRNHIDCVNLLLSRGANPEQLDSKDKSPRDYATTDDVRHLLDNAVTDLSTPTRGSP